LPPETEPEAPKPATVKVIPDTAERQAAAAAAKILAAESARKARGSSTKATPPKTPPKASTAPLRAPDAPAKAPAVVHAENRTPAKRARSTDPVTPVKIQDAVKSMAVEHIQCRDFGHSWRPYSARWMPTFNQYESQLICNRCTTIRTRFMSRTGALLDSKYDYVEGYTVKGMGRLTGHDRDIIRLESILSVLEKDET